MKLKCVAIDDEPLAIALIREYITRIPELRLLHTFEDAIAGSEFLRNNPVDILFVDINMPDISGLSLVASLNEKPAVIFTTAYKKFAFEGFELEAVDYLLKPISFERFEKAVKKALQVLKSKEKETEPVQDDFFVWSEYKQVKIDLSLVEFVEAREDYVLFHQRHQRPVLSLMTLKSVQEKLPVTKFIRIHRSYIIPVSCIKLIGSKKVTLTSGKELPVGNSYASALQEIARR
ncbi:LytR/AlgR family response regulator transcription factor [Pinibacter soli]|uniref:LytTR family DNA-binding domain-containing protein n=1 Tax=Pinibacter soli TaxID=3044211 RepID=A0ABT6RGG8_9BACT|nr:LytTR family DNA-binding domain-containing protein [Pinibacter soli]MDI3321516.1 LytTR family DNA-binding domain-containing protein [Pinibacter soli]